MKIVLNKCYGGYSLSEKAYAYIGIEWDGHGKAFKDDRTHPMLIEAVEALGEEANGSYADLVVEEFDIEQLITASDGFERLRG